MESADDRVAVTAAGGREVLLGPLEERHVDDLFAMFSDAVERGDGYPQTPPLTRESFDGTWILPTTMVVGATEGERLVGAYYLKPNLPGLGAHIANAGYLVDRSARRGGIGRLLVQDSVDRAPLLGFDAVQFNFVFADNPARPLYERLGWREVGQIPDGVGPGRDAIIYWRRVP